MQQRSSDATRDDPLILLRMALQWQVVGLYAAACLWEGAARTVEETLRGYR